MEVKVSGFYKRHIGRTLSVLISLQLLLTLLAGAGAWYALNQGYSAQTTLLVGFGGLFLAQCVLTPIFILQASQPLKIISQAIAHISKDLVQTMPPILNKPSYERTGLRAMVQTIYDLAVKPPAQTAQLTSNTADQHMALFENVPVGLIALNSSGEVVMANMQAPVHKNPDNKLQLSLQFEPSDSLGNWLRSIQSQKLRDTKTWQRIADKLPGEPGRHIYDVIAYYNKNGASGLETLVVTIDRSAQYLPVEEDMDFIALAAHELRGPITVIRGYLDIVADELHGKLRPDQQELLDRLQVSSEQLSGYINNILNVSRYDRKHLQLHLHEERLIDIIKDLVPGLALRAKTRQRRLTFYIPETLPTIAADASSLSEVISNLIDNAIKYSQVNGEVIVRAVVNGDFVEITVQDFGIGIPASVVGNLFTKFYRSHVSRQQVGGTGLGLYICKAIVESHGGHIWVRSQEGKGSVFGFTIPIYSTVADKLAKSDNKNEQIIDRPDGWIKNHSMYLR